MKNMKKFEPILLITHDAAFNKKVKIEIISHDKRTCIDHDIDSLILMLKNIKKISKNKRKIPSDLLK